VTRVQRDSVAGRAYLDVQNLARRTRRPTAELLHAYVLEGFLVRLAGSPEAGSLVLKGGVLLAAFAARRPTRDIDLAARDLSGELDDVLALVRRIAGVEVDDGLVFDPAAAAASTIRDEDQYAGVRVSLPCVLASARVRFHVDVNVGDPIWPAPTVVDLPRVLGGTLQITGYPLGMVYAEKIVTAVERGLANTRWRDFADIYLLSRLHPQDGAELVASITRVARHRQVSVGPLSGSLVGYPALAQARWAAWRRRQSLDGLLPEDFAEVLGAVVAFADPCLGSDTGSGSWDAASGRWLPEGRPA
jgi:Nucleotidyl transferase AbiEii toxin, Type IV TA system